MSDAVFTVLGASHPSCPPISRTKAAALLPALTRDELKAFFREKGIRWRGPIEYMSRRAGERQGFRPGTERSFFRSPAMDNDPTAFWLIAESPYNGRRTLMRVNLAAPVPEFN